MPYEIKIYPDLDPSVVVENSSSEEDSGRNSTELTTVLWTAIFLLKSGDMT